MKTSSFSSLCLLLVTPSAVAWLPAHQQRSLAQRLAMTPPGSSSSSNVAPGNATETTAAFDVAKVTADLETQSEELYQFQRRETPVIFSDSGDTDPVMEIAADSSTKTDAVSLPKLPEIDVDVEALKNVVVDVSGFLFNLGKDGVQVAKTTADSWNSTQVGNSPITYEEAGSKVFQGFRGVVKLVSELAVDSAMYLAKDVEWDEVAKTVASTTTGLAEQVTKGAEQLKKQDKVVVMPKTSSPSKTNSVAKAMEDPEDKHFFLEDE